MTPGPRVTPDGIVDLTPDEVAATQAEWDANAPGTGTAWLAAAAALLANQQQGATTMLQSGADPQSRLIRAVLYSIVKDTVQEFNVIINALNTNTAALTTLVTAITASGATLATIKTAAQGIALPLPTPQTLTAQTVINAILSDIPAEITNNV